MTFSDVLQRYFHLLETGDFDGAAACFSESARYSHPPYADDPEGSARHEAHGREQIFALFARRGVRSTRHAVQLIACTGDTHFVSGQVLESTGEIVGSFISQASFDPAEQRITEYVAYSSRPAVWATRIGDASAV